MSEKQKKEIQLEKIDDSRWRVPQQGKMNVDGIVYTSETLLPHLQADATVEQVMNVAQLPGIVGHSLAMPDAHWGYGFPIGGVAAFDVERGVISPGGVGYDINCLSGDSLILHEHGYTRTIADSQYSWRQDRLQHYNTARQGRNVTDVTRFLAIKPTNAVYRVATSSGKTLTATADHPFYTEQGMTPLQELSPGVRVAVLPFEGVPYEEPSDEIILDEETIVAFLSKLGKDSKGNGAAQIMKHLRKIGLVPLRYDSPQLPYLLKIMGYVTGDGTVYFESASGKGRAAFYGKPDDLELIRRDVAALGFTPSQVYAREHQSAITTLYDTYEVTTHEAHFNVTGSGFAALLAALGVPVGTKTTQDFSVPKCLFRAPLWQKRLYLAALFGAELSTPKTITEHPYNFNPPVLSQNKRDGFVESGRQFLYDIAQFVAEFGVQTQTISSRESYQDAQGNMSRCLRLIFSNTSRNLVNLWSRIGFEYNQHRAFLANVAAHYLIRKEQALAEREEAIREIQEVRVASGGGAKTIYAALQRADINLRFIERAIYEEPRATGARVPEGFPTFEEHCHEVTAGLGMSGFVWDAVTEKHALNFIGKVYDFTVAHQDHNFIANGCLVSNCGVRLMRSNLTRSDVERDMKDLVAALFKNIPSGVGSQRADLKLTEQNERLVLTRGAQWAVAEGFGTQADLDHIEESGCLAGANPEIISKEAYKRGRPQLGTLGSGNHFVEIGCVEEIYNPAVAAALGLELDAVTVIVHTGSRGLGYQVCDDFLVEMLNASRKYGIALPDKQLCCAPISSDEGRRYYSAMACAANYAFANRQIITHWVRETFERVLQKTPRELQMNLIYDVAHNIAKFETYLIDGKERKLCVHRKGATRAFPAKHPDVPSVYQAIGQPVLIPGDMGRCSYVLVGTDQAMTDTFGSTCHGAGRMLSRTAAIKRAKGRAIWRELADQGIVVKSEGRETLAEEMPEAYKNVSDVVDVVQNAGISRKVVKLRPLGVIKG